MPIAATWPAISGFIIPGGLRLNGFIQHLEKGESEGGTVFMHFPVPSTNSGVAGLLNGAILPFPAKNLPILDPSPPGT